MLKYNSVLHHTTSALAHACALTLLCLPAYVFGAGTPSFIPPIEGDISKLLITILNATIYILFPFIVLMIVYTGFLFVTAQGNATKITQAREALVWTVVGALVVLGAKAIALAIEATVDSLRVAP
ncbi:MAG: hypothetical protein KBD21_03040 [Candidatus Pacebacteria bacterium]|nr:hypothetical protein [Candidatus Paceibacterota bacterium]